MYRFYLLILSLFGGLVSHAASTDYQWLIFSLNDGTQLSVSADNLEITYLQGSLRLSSTTVDETLDVSDLRSMKFSDTSTRVESMTDEMDIHPFAVYSLDGVMMGEFNSCDEARDVLPRGTYIMKNKYKIIKIIF